MRSIDWPQPYSPLAYSYVFVSIRSSLNHGPSSYFRRDKSRGNSGHDLRSGITYIDVVAQVNHKVD